MMPPIGRYYTPPPQVKREKIQAELSGVMFVIRREYHVSRLTPDDYLKPAQRSFLHKPVSPTRTLLSCHDARC